MKGPKVGGAVEKSVANVGKIPAKTAGIFANAAVQASPNLFSMAVDHLQNGGDLSNADALYDTMAQSLAMIPLGKTKGLSAKLAKDAPVEQMRMGDEAPVPTIETLVPEIVKAKKTKTKKGLSAKLETPVAENVKSPEVPVLNIEETPIAPVKDAGGEDVKLEEASLLNSDTSNGFDTVTKKNTKGEDKPVNPIKDGITQAMAPVSSTRIKT